jgi:hypothetical protein
MEEAVATAELEKILWIPEIRILEDEVDALTESDNDK